MTIFMVINFIPETFAEKNEENAIKIYVAVDGNDENSGTIEAPIKSFSEIKERILEAKATMNEPKEIQIIMRGGEYRITSSLDLNNSFSGVDAEHPVTFMSYENEKVIFKGSISLSISDFRTCETNELGFDEDSISNIKCLDLSKYEIEPTEAKAENLPGRYSSNAAYYDLYLNGYEQLIAQWPNGDYNYSSFSLNEESTNSSGGVVAESFYADELENVSRWTQVSNAYACGYFGYNYRIENVPIQSIDTNTGLVTLGKATDFGVRNQVARRWKIKNIAAELDSAGEWYIDKEDMMLYYYMPDNVSTNSLIELSVMENPAIILRGTSNIKIEGLGFSQIRNHAILGYKSGTKSIDGLEINGCDFTYISGCGINLSEIKWGSIRDQDYSTLVVSEVKNIKITNNLFYSVGGGGIGVNSGNSDTLTSNNCEIKNNYFTYPKAEFGGNLIGISGGVGITTSNNTAHNAPHKAYDFSGSYHEINNNEVSSVIRDTSDAGAFYSGRTVLNRDNILSYNYIKDLMPVSDVLLPHAKSSGIYFDDGYSAGNVENNIIANSSIGVSTSGNGSNIKNNTIINSPVSVSMSLSNFAKNAYSIYFNEENQKTETAALYNQRFPEIEEEFEKLVELDYTGSVYNEVTGNLSVFSSDPEINLQNEMKIGNTFENNSVISNVSDFVDYENGDYRIKTGSAILSKNPELISQSLNMAEIGVQWDEGFDKNRILSKRKFAFVDERFSVNEGKLSDINLSWEKSFDADSYTVVISTDENFKNIIYKETVPYNYCFIDELNVVNSDYWWTVYANNETYSMNGVWQVEGGKRHIQASESGDTEFKIQSAELSGNVLELTFNRQLEIEKSKECISIYDENGKINNTEYVVDLNVLKINIPYEYIGKSLMLNIDDNLMSNDGVCLDESYRSYFKINGFYEDFGDHYSDGDWIFAQMNGYGNLEEFNAQIENGKMLVKPQIDTDTMAYAYKNNYEKFSYKNSVLEFDFNGIGNNDAGESFAAITKLNNSADTSKKPIYGSGWYGYINSGYVTATFWNNRSLYFDRLQQEKNWERNDNALIASGQCATGIEYRFRIVTENCEENGEPAVNIKVYKATYNGNENRDFILVSDNTYKEFCDHSEGSFAFGTFNWFYGMSESVIDNVFFGEKSIIQLEENESVLEVEDILKEENEIVISFNKMIDKKTLSGISVVKDNCLINTDKISEGRSVRVKLPDDIYGDYKIIINNEVKSIEGLDLSENFEREFEIKGFYEDFSNYRQNDWKITSWNHSNGIDAVYNDPENNIETKEVLRPMSNTKSFEEDGKTLYYSQQPMLVHKKNYMDYDFTNQTLYFDYYRDYDTRGDEGSKRQINFKAFVRAGDFEYSREKSVINIADGAYYFGIENQGEKCHIGKIVGEWNINRLYTIPENVTILSEKKNTNILANTVYGFKINVKDTQTGVLITVFIKNEDGNYEEFMSATDTENVLTSGKSYFVTGDSNWGAYNSYKIDNVSFGGDDIEVKNINESVIIPKGISETENNKVCAEIEILNNNLEIKKAEIYVVSYDNSDNSIKTIDVINTDMTELARKSENFEFFKDEDRIKVFVYDVQAKRWIDNILLYGEENEVRGEGNTICQYDSETDILFASGESTNNSTVLIIKNLWGNIVYIDSKKTSDSQYCYKLRTDLPMFSKIELYDGGKVLTLRTTGNSGGVFTTASVSGGELILNCDIQNQCDELKDCLLYVALYDENKKLTEVYSIENKLDFYDAQILRKIKLLVGNSYSTLKVFSWDGTMNPLCDSIEIKK